MKSILLIMLALSFPLSCYAVDLNELYATDYHAFWTRWHKAEKAASQCNDYEATAKFISDALTILGNAEVTEANDKTIENMTIKNAKCLLEALLRLKSAERNKAIYKFLWNPIFHEQSEIQESLKKVWNAKKYHIIRDEYQRIQKKPANKSIPLDK